MLLGTQRITDQGRLEIGGCDAVELAREFGTPLYVMDEAHVRHCCREYRRTFESRYPNTMTYYAGKAFLCPAMCRIADQEGLGLDVASGGELYTALKADFPSDRILLHGNNKADWEIEMALDARVGRIVSDSMDELDLLNTLAGQRGQIADVLVRVTPGVKAKTHTLIQTGQIDTKFGLAIETGQALAGCRHALELPNVNLRGIHSHIGSQVLGLKFFEIATKMMTDFMAELRDSLRYEIEELNLGGGLGVRYLATDDSPGFDRYADTIIVALRQALDWHNLRPPRLMNEPGRSIVGEAGTTLYTVGVVKEITGVRKYVSVDGGIYENPRPALYQAEYEAIVANKANQPPVERYTIAGKHCETDVLYSDLELPHLEVGDILAVQTTGAYHYAMASNYNRLCRPAVVLVSDGQADIIVRREELDDLVSHDVIPDRLMARAPA